MTKTFGKFFLQSWTASGSFCPVSCCLIGHARTYVPAPTIAETVPSTHLFNQNPLTLGISAGKITSDETWSRPFLIVWYGVSATTVCLSPSQVFASFFLKFWSGRGYYSAHDVLNFNCCRLRRLLVLRLLILIAKAALYL